MRVVICIILLALVMISGCTLNFKGEKVELESELVLRYELESIDILKQNSPIGDESEEPWTESQIASQ